MTLTQLRYILAVARCHNFAQAARECYVTQPTLSMQIQKLEDYLQIIIFDRKQTPVAPTALGEKVLQMAREVVQKADGLEELARVVRKEIAGEFRLAVIPTIAPYLVPLFVDDFGKKFPKVDLRIYEYQTDEIISLLKEDKLDAGILATPLNEKTLKEEILFYEPFKLLLSPKHPLLKGKDVAEKELSLEEAWLLKEGHCLRAQALQLCRPKGQPDPKKLHFEGGSLETLVNLVRTSGGYTVLPYLATMNMTKDDTTRLRDFRMSLPVREVSLVTGPFALKEAISSSIKKCVLENLPAPLSQKAKKARVLDI